MTDNMRIWQAVEKTDPDYTKHVNQRGGFTAVSANYQLMQATKQFGPIGIGWGYIAGEPVFHDNLVFVPVTLWHGDRANTFGPMLGCEEWKSAKGHIDSDASKKATTDAITKLLSQLGFSADVFLGKYDDQKYVAELRAEKNKAEYITVDQIGELQAMIEGYGFNVGEVCKSYNIQSLAEIPAEEFVNVRNNINAKYDKKKAKEAK